MTGRGSGPARFGLLLAAGILCVALAYRAGPAGRRLAVLIGVMIGVMFLVRLALVSRRPR